MVTFFVRNWEKSFYYFGSFSSPGLRETQIPTKTGRPWNEMRRPGVQFHVLTQWLDKGPDFLWWNTIFDKGEMSKNPGHCRSEVYLYSLLCSVNVERRNMDRKWTPNLVYQRILKLETWRKSGSQCLGQMSVSSKIQSISVSLHFWFNEILPLWIWGYIYFLCGNPFKFRRRKKLCSVLCFRKTLYS